MNEATVYWNARGHAFIWDWRRRDQPRRPLSVEVIPQAAQTCRTHHLEEQPMEPQREPEPAIPQRMLDMTSIIVIATYFGKWPVWFPAFLLSCARNDTLEWLFFTDCDLPRVSYRNIRFERMNLGQLNDLASRQLGFRIQKGAYSQVDLQPAYGVIFQQYIEGFDFWGHCDIDVIWGNIRGFLTEDTLQNHDILSFRKDFLAGHLTVWRNEPEINSLFSRVPAYRQILSSAEHRNFDENVMSTFLRTVPTTGTGKIRVFWPEQMVVWFHGKANPNGWYWDNGRVFDPQHHEHVYLHLQDSKKSVTFIDFQVGDQPVRFKFTQLGIQSRSSIVCHFPRMRFQWEAVEGSLSRLVAWSKKSLRVLKKALLVKDIYWASRLTSNSIGARDVRYDRKLRRLCLRHLDFHIGRQQQYLLETYHEATQLADQGTARFSNDGQGTLFVDVAGIRASVQGAEEILTLKELLLDGICNTLFSRPTVVLDIGMNSGLASLYYASLPQVVVVGYEPGGRSYSRALLNISLNPALADKIRAFKAGVGDSKIRTIAMYPPKTGRSYRSSRQMDNGKGPRFEYEEVHIEDAAEILDSIVSQYPERDVVVRIDLERSEYFIDGLSEHQVIDRLLSAGKLRLVETIMLKWDHEKSRRNPSVARQLSDCGFKVFSFSAHDAHQRVLYAVRSRPSQATPSSAGNDSAALTCNFCA